MSGKSERIALRVDVGDLILVDEGLPLTYQWEAKYSCSTSALTGSTSPLTGSKHSKTFVGFRVGGVIRLTKNADIHTIPNGETTLYYMSKLDEDVVKKRLDRLRMYMEDIIQDVSMLC